MPDRDRPPPHLHLVKYQALGNDYLVVDLPDSIGGLPELAVRLCDRHLGIGADGLLAFDPDRLALRVFNPDGSEAEKSGNGLRIAACHAVLEHGAGGEFRVSTRDRSNVVRILAVDEGEVASEVEMGNPVFDPDDWVLIETPAGRVHCRLVSVGNPHCVVFDEPVSEERCRELGPLLERNPRFPQRTNVQLVEVLDPGRARIEIWERGAGHTLASGSSAAAAAAVLIHLGRTQPEVEMMMPGGSLQVRQLPSGSLLQAGPARRVFRAEVDPADLDHLDGTGRLHD
ncbi:diaminopimelate epimerase [Candidatus Nephthysia bennettiae]|uniref:Diaminopimelate epimerase n=1 Tax=Candidatus Nephthysia bennettiae TaxID=3127016 RepID=A0A934K4P8_9BACT|nr:diaminopimelate epimerase [Candidatus Dormibacteraeota bacterium]MBJ7613037.1 diaminopimelate epimerase [Candidatus Dormibacteraeota bacterium]